MANLSTDFFLIHRCSTNMREWVSHFSSKYTIVGELVNEGEQGDD
jgi:hypothetical protein